MLSLVPNEQTPRSICHDFTCSFPPMFENIPIYSQVLIYNFIDTLRNDDHILDNVLCLVIQLCLTLCDPMDCSPPGSSIHEILQARILKWVANALLQGIFPTQGSNPCLLHWQDSLPLGHWGNPIILYN